MPEKIRLGFYMYTIAVGGAEQYLRDLLWLLDRERYEITLFYEPWKPFVQFLGLDACPSVHLCPIPVYETNMKERHGQQIPRKTLLSRIQQKKDFVLTIPRNIFLLKQAFVSNPVDVLHISNGGYPAAWTAQLASLAAKAAGIPICLMTIANTPTRSRSGPVWQLFDHQVARAVNCFIAVAKYVGQMLVEQRKFPPEKIQTIYYGTSSPAEVTGEDIAALRQQVGISPGHLVIAMAARISPEKGHRYLLSALAKIRPQIGENISVLIMGDGPARENIQTQARALGLDEMVTFTGYLPNAEVLRLLAACDLVTLPSEIEGLPYMITEAMSLGKTVVATQVGGIPEQIIHGKTGLLVPPHNVDALAETLLQLINNPSLLQHMGKEAQKRHRELFSLERMIQEHETLYHTFINNVNRKI